MKLKARSEALEKAHKTLEEFSHEDLNANMPKAAFIKAFECTYELSWKSMKSAAELKGLDSNSPRDAIRNGLKLNIISDEPLWLSIQRDRNTTAHTYSVDYLPEMIARIKDQYVAEFLRLVEALKLESQRDAP